MTINVECAINNLSFGNVSVNILKAFYKKGIDANIFPIGNPDLGAFDGLLTADFVGWIQNGLAKSLKDYKATNPTFKQWHINGAQNSVGKEQSLLTFHECSELTDFEANILSNQKNIFITSQWSKSVFENYGLKNVIYCPLGFDSDSFRILNGKRAYPDNVTVWFLGGKFERRKSTAEVIRSWVKKYGNNRKHVLQLAVYNNFYSKEQNEQFLAQVFENQKPFNVNILGFSRTNIEYNQVLNACDIVIDMGKGEAWSLPSFTAVGLGKHAVVLNATGIMSWANNDNAVLVEPSGMIDVYDNIFFHKGSQFNQGNYFTYLDDDLIVAFDKVYERYQKSSVNHEGIKIQTDFTWSKTADIILNNL